MGPGCRPDLLFCVKVFANESFLGFGISAVLSRQANRPG